MKCAIISDSHGNLEAFKAVVADARKRECQRIICLGDLTGYGLKSKECVRFAMKNVDVCLMGNHDIVSCGKEEPLEFISNRNFDVDIKTRKLLTNKEREWLSSRPYVWYQKDFACAHSEFSSPSDWFYILKPQDAWQSLWSRSEQILFVGHTHIPFLMKIPPRSVEMTRSFDEKEAMSGMRGLVQLKAKSCVVVRGARYVVNVGSVGLPRRGSRATYCVYDHQSRKLELVSLEDFKK